MEMKYPHLLLNDWPFQVVPDDKFEKIWADRREVLDDIHVILNGLSRRDQSSINLLWAWFGAGKSHTMKHMQHLCRHTYTEVLPIYTELPRRISSFLDLYKFFVDALGSELVRELAIDVYLKNTDLEIIKKLKSTYEEFSRMLEHLATGNDEEELIAWRWLSVKSVRNSEFRKYGIAKRIEHSDDAVRALSALVQLINASQRFSRVLWMIDEFQRIGLAQKEVLGDVNSGLHSVFNSAPVGFSLMLSFSVKQQESIYNILSSELRDRIGISKIIKIPKMNEQEAITFISDLLFEFRSGKENLHDPYFPFTEESIKYLIIMISQSAEIKPRSIMQYFNAVLERAEPLIEIGQLKNIDIKFIQHVFSGNQVIYSLNEETTASLK
jgi:hypothetical protein